MQRQARDLRAAQKQAAVEQRKAEEGRLLDTIAGNRDFHEGRPVVALAIFRCCLQWGSFQVCPPLPTAPTSGSTCQLDCSC
jgi:hypothetical protein